MLAEPFRDQRQPDEQQERERQHLHRRVPLHELGDRGRGEQHREHGNDDRGDHDGDILRHADGGNHRVEREDDIEQENLDDDARKRCAPARGLFRRIAFEVVVNLARALEDQEKTAAGENQ